MDSSKCILLLIGIPGAGKSTLIERLGPILCKHGIQSTVISYDTLLPADVEHELIKNRGNQWKQSRNKILQSVEELIKQRSIGNDSIGCDEMPVKSQYDDTSSQPGVIIIDDNMYYHSMRYVYYQLARKYNTGFAQVLVQCPVEVALQRNRQREFPVPDDVIVSMTAKLEPPDPISYHWELHSVTVETVTDSCHLDQVVDVIITALNDPVQPLPQEDCDQIVEDRQICSANVIHQADQIMRKLIGNSMAHLKELATAKEDMKDQAFSLNAKRQDILDQLKDGQKIVPTEDKNTCYKTDANFHSFIEQLFSR